MSTERRTPMRHTTMLIVVIALAMAAVLVAVLSGRAAGPLESSWAYEQGLQLAHTHPGVRQALGEPIDAGAVDGFERISGETGDAEMSIPLAGSRGGGVLRLVARKRHGRWAFERAEVELDEGRGRIGLIDERRPSTSREPTS